MLFFRAGSSDSYDLMLKMKHAAMPFRVMDGLEGDLEVDAATNGSALTLRLHDEGVDGKSSEFRMVYPREAYVGDDFRLSFKYTLIDGNVSGVRVDLFDDTDEWLYPFNASENFVLTPDSKDAYGYANLHGDTVSLIEIVIPLDDGASATISLEELSVSSSGDFFSLEFYARDNEEIRYEVFIERDFRPTILYGVALALSVAFGVATLYCLYKRIKNRQ
jgi:hypothetical protein